MIWYVDVSCTGVVSLSGSGCGGGSTGVNGSALALPSWHLPPLPGWPGEQRGTVQQQHTGTENIHPVLGPCHIQDCVRCPLLFLGFIHELLTKQCHQQQQACWGQHHFKCSYVSGNCGVGLNVLWGHSVKPFNPSCTSFHSGEKTEQMKKIQTGTRRTCKLQTTSCAMSCRLQ